MTTSWRRPMNAVLMITVAVSTLLVSSGVAPGAAGPADPTDGLQLYVADRGAGAISVYRSDSAGSVHPDRVLPLDSSCGPTDVWGVAVGAAGAIYTQSYLSESCTRVLSADGRSQRSFRGFARDSPAIAVAPDGTTYVARLQSPEIDAFGPDAVGQQTPQRVLTLDGYPRSVAVDGAGNLVVAVQSLYTGNAIETFTPTASGAATPFRRISGPATGLGTSVGFLGEGEQVLITYSTVTRRLYAAVTGAAADPVSAIPASQTHISVFTGTSTGDQPPLRTICGPRTQLGGSTLTGVANNPASGNIWVMATSGGLGSPSSVGQILDFPRLGDGNISPVRSFTDASSRFADVQGIAFGPAKPQV